jgi:hypothetical protein
VEKRYLTIGMCTVLVFIAGCVGIVRTREYVPPQKDRKIQLLDGWMVEPEVFAYKNVIGADPKTWWSFHHEFRFSTRRLKKEIPLGRITVVEVDSIAITFAGLDSTISIPFDGRTWVSYSTDDDLVYLASYNCRDSTPCILKYPKEIENATLRMKVHLYEATHTLTLRHSVSDCDSVVTDYTRLLRDTVIEVPLRLRETAFPVPAIGGP